MTYCEAQHRKAAERLVLFVQDEMVASIVRKHTPFLHTALGQRIWQELFSLADGLHCGDFAPSQYGASIELVAPTCNIPIEELRIIARFALELDRCSFFGDGHRPAIDLQLQDQDRR
jgi:hypothetical protein